MFATLSRARWVLGMAALALAISSPLSARQPAQLKVSENKRFLVTADGRPFFWLGDTAWELFHRLDREDGEAYLENRAEQRLHRRSRRWRWRSSTGLTTRTPTATGRSSNNDPAKPDVKDGPDNDYWDHVDFIVKQAERARPVRRLAADVGRQVEQQKRGAGPEIFTPENAERYGEWLGRAIQGDAEHHLDSRRRSADRDRRAQGDHPGDGARPARGRRRRAPDDVPSARRPTARRPGSTTDEWLDFNMRQNGHVAGVHRPLRPDARRLRPHADQAGARRRADLRGSPGLVRRQAARPLDRGRRPPAALLGSLHRRVRAHLRAPLRLADVDARRGRRSTTRCCRGPRPSTSRARRRCSTAAR